MKKNTLKRKTLKLKKLSRLLVCVAASAIVSVCSLVSQAAADNLQFTLTYETQATQTMTKTSPFGFVKYWWSLQSKPDWVSSVEPSYFFTYLPQEVQVTVDRGDLGTGTYNGEIVWRRWVDGSTNYQYPTDSVTLIIEPPPTIPDTDLQFILPHGQTQATQTMTKTSPFGFVKYWWSLQSKPSWVSSVEPSYFFTYIPQEVQVTVDRGGFGHGTYIGEIVWCIWIDGKTNYQYPTDSVAMVIKPPPSISGTVKDQDNNGLSGLTVSAGGRSDDTDQDGLYEITDLTNGTHTVEVSNAGYNFKSKDVTIDGDDETCNFYTIFGYVKEDGADGTVLSGVNIKLDDQTYATSQADGYRIGLPQGNYNVTASYSDYIFSPSPFAVNITNASRNDIHFYTYDIDGYVKRYGTNVGENRIDVRITGGDRDIDITVQTHDRDGDPLDPGYYKLEHIGGGTYTIEATNP